MKKYKIDKDGNRRPTKRAERRYERECGKAAAVGYAISEYNNTGMLEINRIDEMEVFDNDEQAVEQAIKDGVKIIPVDELPENFDSDRRYQGWIDTPENREAIAAYCLLS